MQIAVLDTLAQLGCDPSVKDSVSSTPMHVAAGEGHIEAILKLVALVSNAVLALSTQLHHIQKQSACVVCQYCTSNGLAVTRRCEQPALCYAMLHKACKSATCTIVKSHALSCLLERAQ